MILELDCGNSLIKWRIIDTNATLIARGAAEESHQLFTELNNYKQHFSYCRLVSVRSEQSTLEIINQLKIHYHINIKQAISTPYAYGVKNGYIDHTRLGADRWSAIIAAYNTSKSAVLVLGFGTAITSDFINTEGIHLGGFITPGLLLMRKQLLSNTGRIHYDKHIEIEYSELPGNCTEEAIDNGCHLMIQSFIKQQLTLANQYVESPSIFVSGGDAKYFDIPNAIYSPDLIFEGLALLCPLPDGQ